MENKTPTKTVQEIQEIQALFDAALIPPVVRLVTRFLESEDAALLRRVNRFFKKSISRHGLIDLANLHMRGEYSDPNRSLSDHMISCRHPIEFMDLRADWRDQGWGNRKGQLFLRAIRPITYSNTQQKQLFEHSLCGVAEHQSVHVHLRVSGIFDNLEPGDIIMLFRHVGGGGGHELFVDKYRLIITWAYQRGTTLSPPPPTQSQLS